ncbi:MAG: efflux RND transporter permease subunit [Lentisphaeria bacterium]
MIWNFCIRRPVLTIVLFLIMAIFGVYGYQQMPVRENPDVEFPIVSVNVVLPGAEPEVIETEIIEPLEEEINTVEGLKELTSTAREQVGTIVAEFELWRDIDIAAQDIRDRVNRAQRELPDDIEAPIVQKMDPGSRSIMWITLTGDERWDRIRMSEYADTDLKERLQGLRGVGQIMIGGERKYAVRLQVDTDKLAAHHLTIGDVIRTVEENNVDIPAGRVESKRREFLIKTQGQFASAEPINNLIITSRDGAPVRIRDVGRAVDAVENDRQLARFNGRPTVGIGVIKQSDANMVELADSVRKRIEEIAKDFPPGLEYTIVTDDSVYVQESINDLLITIFLATGLVVLVVLAFLRNGRGTLITTIAIPTSLMGGLALMYVLGFSLNTLTLLGLILVIGIVVDDAIVILESSYRHVEKGASAMPASRTGTTEVAFPAIANSLALAAVFIPVAFTAGLIGRYFFEFGLTVAVTVFTSTLTALTLVPMLCSRVLRAPEKHNVVFRFSEKLFTGLESVYKVFLNAALRFRWLTVLIGISALAAGLFCFKQLSTEFAPDVDRSEFMISFETPEGSTLSETQKYSDKIEEVLSDTPEVEHFMLIIGLSRGGPGKPSNGFVFVRLTPENTRDQHQSAVMQDVRGKLGRVAGGNAYVLKPSMGPSGGAPLQIVIQHSEVDALANEQERVMNWMRGQPEFVGVNSDLKLNKPQIDVRIKRDKASEAGISVADIANTMRFLFGEPDISKIERGSERYDILTETAGRGEMTPGELKDIYVRGSQGQLISLGNLITIKETVGPSEIHHFNRRRAVTISSSNPPGVALGDALSKLENYLNRTLGDDFSHTVSGMAQDFKESFYYLSITLIFAVVFIYLVLAAQFESFLHPLTILMALPLASVGAFGSLWAFGMTFNILAFIGLIMLLGIVTKNAILLVDYANVLRARGRSLFEAAGEAAETRFRPVLMTAVSTILGMLPIALGFGAGGEARAPLGVSVSMGMVSATLLTLVVIPVVYTLFSQLQDWLTRSFR